MSVIMCSRGNDVLTSGCPNGNTVQEAFYSKGTQRGMFATILLACYSKFVEHKISARFLAAVLAIYFQVPLKTKCRDIMLNTILHTILYTILNTILYQIVDQ